MSPPAGPIAVLYEQAEWQRPLFAELGRRGLPHARVDVAGASFDPADPAPGWSLAFNRMSPSAYLRGLPGAVAWTRACLAHLEARGVRVVNGTRAFAFETSKARQLSLFEALGVPYPAARVVHRPEAASEAAAGLRFPVVVKPNVGGCGAGIRRFARPSDLEAAVRDGLDLGPDGTALVQELVPRRDDAIVRIEVVGGEPLYAIRVVAEEGCFDLCPADIRRERDEAGRAAEPYRPPPEAVERAVAIADAAGMEVAGVEYLVDDRDGTLRFYDLNANSNFVAEAPGLLGFDPFARLVDYLERVARDAPRAAGADPGPEAGSASGARRSAGVGAEAAASEREG